MATAEQRKQSHDEVRALLDELSAIDATSLGRRSELSPDINFEEVVPDFQTMLEVVRQLQARDLSRIPHRELENIKNPLSQLKVKIEDILNFTLTQANPADVRNNICKQVNTIYDAVVQPMLLPLAFTATQATDYAKIEREAKGFHSELSREAEAFKNTLAKQKKDAEQALAAIKQQAAEAGVSGHAKNYSDQAEKHREAAKRWFFATLAAVGVTLLVATGTLLLAFWYTPTGIPETIQYVVAKLILLSVLTFAIFWCSRNYRSEKHNETLNRHRANALATFKTFVEGTHDSATRNAILIFCAQAAFGHQPSGYESHDGTETPPQIVNPVVELLGKHPSTNS